MKCISLWQPWATLMVVGAKCNETRSWRTNYRGPLGIHAAKYFPRENQELCYEEPFQSALDKAGFFTPFVLPLGALIGQVEIVDCVPTLWCNMEMLDRAPWLIVTETELSFGDYSPGRFAWVTSLPVQFALPIPYKGHQGFFEVA